MVYLTEQPSASFRVALERAGLLGNEKLFVLPFNAVASLEWPGIAKLATENCRKVGAVGRLTLFFSIVYPKIQGAIRGAKPIVVT